MKKILIMGDYFCPDVASTGQLLTELCLELQNDFKITVLTSVPSFKSEEYREKINFGKCQDCESCFNIDLVRVKTKPFDKRNKLSRIKHIIEHYLMIKEAIRQVEKQDIVFTISQPPILGGLLGLYAKKTHKAKFIYNIQDFNPEQAEAVGYLKFKLLFRLLKRTDTRTCRKADKVLIVGNDMKQTLINRGIEINKKVVLINNWIDEEKIFPQENKMVSDFKSKYGLKDKLVIMYSGNIGLYYDLENIVKIIGRFNGRKDVIFAFVGDGVRKKDIEGWVNENKIDNIQFIPFQDKESVVYSLNAADVHLISNKKGIKGVSVPSKIYGALAVGKYIIGIQEKGSEAEEIITKSGCGTVVEPEDYENIFAAIYEAINMDELERRSAGLKGREYLEMGLRKSHSIEKYREMFRQYG